MPFQMTADSPHRGTGELDKMRKETRKMLVTMDAVEKNLDKLHSSLQNSFSKLVAQSKDNTSDPFQKVSIKIKRREVRKSGDADLDIPAIDSVKVDNSNQTDLESDKKVVKPHEVTRIRIRQYKKIERIGEKSPGCDNSKDQEPGEARKSDYQRITYRKKLVQHSGGDSPKFVESSDIANAAKVIVPRTNETRTYTDRKLDLYVNKEHSVSTTRTTGSSKVAVKQTSERISSTSDASSDLVASNDEESATVVLKVSVRPTQPDNGIQNPLFPINNAKDAQLAENSMIRPLLVRNDVRSPTSTQNNEKRQLDIRSDVRTPTFGLSSKANMSHSRYIVSSPQAVRSGARCRSISRTDGSPTLAENCKSIITEEISSEISTMKRGNTASPVLKAKCTTTQVLAKSPLASMPCVGNPISISASGSPQSTRREGCGNENHTFARTCVSKYMTERRGIESLTPTRNISAPSRKDNEYTILSRNDDKSEVASRNNTTDEEIAVSYSPNGTPTRRNSRTPVWRDSIGHDSMNAAQSYALVRPPSVQSPVERRLQKMVDRLESYNVSVSPKMERVKESLSPRKPLYENHVRPAIKCYVTENSETRDSIKSFRIIKQGVPSVLHDKKETHIKQHTEQRLVTDRTISKVMKESNIFQELYNKHTTNSISAAGRKTPIRSYRSPTNETNIRRTSNSTAKDEQPVNLDTEMSMRSKEPRSPEHQIEFQSVTSPISDDRTSETRDIVRDLKFSSPTQSPSGSPISSESGTTINICLLRNLAIETKSKPATDLQNGQKQDTDQFNTPTYKPQFKTLVHLQNKSREDLIRYRRNAHESDFKTTACHQNDFEEDLHAFGCVKPAEHGTKEIETKLLTSGSVKIQQSLEDGSNFQQITIKDSSFISNNLPQSNGNSAFLLESYDKDQHLLAHSTPIREESTVFHAPFSPNNELQPVSIRQTLSVSTKSEKYYADLDEKYRPKLNQNGEVHKVDKMMKKNTITRTDETKDLPWIDDSAAGTSKDTKDDFDRYLALNSYSNRSKQKRPRKESKFGNDFKSRANISKLAELVEHQIHKLRNSEDHQNDAVTCETNKFRFSETKEIKDEDGDSNVKLTQDEHQILKLKRKKCLMVELGSENARNVNVTREEREELNEIEKLFPVGLDSGMRTQIDIPQEEQHMLKVVRRRHIPEGLESENGISANIPKDKKSKLVPVSLKFEKGTQLSETQEMQTNTRQSKDIDNYKRIDQVITTQETHTLKEIENDSNPVGLSIEKERDENTAQEMRRTFRHFKDALDKDNESNLKAFQSDLTQEKYLVHNPFDIGIRQVQQDNSKPSQESLTKAERVTRKKLKHRFCYTSDNTHKQEIREHSFKSLESQTRSTVGSQTDILMEQTKILRNEQSSQTEVSPTSRKQRQFADDYTFELESARVNNDIFQDNDVEVRECDKKPTDAAKEAVNNSINYRFQIEIWKALSDNVHQLRENIEQVLSTRAIPKDGGCHETIIIEAEYMLLNNIKTLLSLCSCLDRDEFRDHIEELICRLHGACFEQGERPRDNSSMDEMRTVLDGLTTLTEDLSVREKSLFGDKNCDSKVTDAEKEIGTSRIVIGLSGFIATANKEFTRFFYRYRREEGQDCGRSEFPRRGLRTKFEHLCAFVQRNLYISLLVSGIILGIVIVTYGPPAARAVYDLVLSNIMNIFCNARLTHSNPPIV